MEGLEINIEDWIMNKIIYEDIKNVINNLGDLVWNFEGAKILITGHQGFIGSSLLTLFYFLNKEIFKQRINVTCIDSKIVDLEDLTKEFSEDFNIIFGNAAKDIPPEEFDYIFHCAGIASPSFYRKFPLETIYANAIFLWDMLNKVSINKLKGFLYFSSSEIYGNPDIKHIPTAENYRGHVSCTGSRACYDESKRVGETISISFVKQKKIPIKMVRPFNIYGPFMRLEDKRVIPDFVRYAFKKKSIQIFSDGSPTRAFCYSSDALEGFIRALLMGKPGRPYNIGNNKEEISILKLAELISDIIGNVNIEYKISSEKDYLTDNPQRRCPNIDRATTELDYKPKISIREGLERILSWYKETYKL